jgi:3-methyladenine DNA glycosylase AlkD
MTAERILDGIKAAGKESYKRVIMNHGAREPVYGASIADMKALVKGIKRDYALAKELWASGVYDAMYLAGLVADDAAMTREDLDAWVSQAYCHGLAENTVAWVAAGGRYGVEMAEAWIADGRELVEAAGWSTYCGLVALKADADLDLPRLGALLDRIAATVHSRPNRARYCMNNYVACAGVYVTDLTERALATAAAIGPVEVDMDGTACRVPDAAETIAKARARGNWGKKRKTVKC